MQPDYLYAAQVLRIIDADTLHCRVDLGFRLHLETPVRLFGVNAPERNTAAGRNATAWVSQWLDKNGRDVVIRSAKPGDYGDKYGRWLGSIYVTQGGIEYCLNKELLTAGQAAVMKF